MRVYVHTSHRLYANGQSAEVDSDRTVRFKLKGSAVENRPDQVETAWMDRDDLLTLRAMVNKALRLMS